MALANFMKGNYAEALNLISEYLGRSKKIDVPDSIIERFRGNVRLVTKFIAEQQLTRFLIASFMAGLIPEEHKELVLIIDKGLAENLLKEAVEIASNKEKLEKVFKKYSEAGIPEEAAEADILAVKMLRRVLEKR